MEAVMSEETQNETMTHEAMREAFITMAVESWKLARAFGNMLRTIEPHRQNRYAQNAHPRAD